MSLFFAVARDNNTGLDAHKHATPFDDYSVAAKVSAGFLNKMEATRDPARFTAFCGVTDEQGYFLLPDLTRDPTAVRPPKDWVGPAPTTPQAAPPEAAPRLGEIQLLKDKCAELESQLKESSDRLVKVEAILRDLMAPVPQPTRVEGGSGSPRPAGVDG